MMQIRSVALGAVVAVGLVVAGCGSGSSGSSSGSSPGSQSEPSGSITVLTQRTDIVDSVFRATYLPLFKRKYPKVDVTFQAITDYENEVRIRMNTKNYGDVLLIPNSVTSDQLPKFFEPLGAADELGKKYRFTKTPQTYQGKVYGLAITGNAQGILYNKKVFADAGITTLPRTPEEFIADLKQVKARTKAIPLYTNYAAGWTMTQWEGHRGEVTGDPDASTELTQDDAPWAAGKEHNVIDTLLYDVVHDGLTEADPTTTDWESSKPKLANGQIATMVLGSWAITQFQDKATNRADVGYMPFPVNVGGTQYSAIGPDYMNAINIHSEHKAAARAWIDWFTGESNYAFDNGGIPTRLDARLPAQYDDFTKAGVKFIELNPAPAGQEGLDKRIDAKAEIGLWDPKYRQRIVDAARGQDKESLEAIFTDLNTRWSRARADIT